MDKMFTLALVPLVVWAGIFFYLLMLDRKLARAEMQKGQDDL